MPTESFSPLDRRDELAYKTRAALAQQLGTKAPEDLRSKTCCLTLLAGAGTRWVKSLAAAKQKLIGEVAGDDSRLIAEFPLDAPRGLFPVRNFIAAEPLIIPMAAYALDALSGLGQQIIVVRGWESEIRSGILAPLGIEESNVVFCTQKEGPSGKVLGHGDAARQSKELWKQSRYTVINFGGDANSPFTALASLLTLAERNAAGEDVGLLLPVAKILNPVYPVVLDSAGLPRAFGHNKLGGGAATGQAENGQILVPSTGFAYTNVGIRAYRTEALLAAIEEIEDLYWREGIGYSIPGNDPEAHEFALDNVDALLASRGKARILAIAQPEELTPAKSFDEIGNFEAATEKVRVEWERFKSARDSQ